MMKMAFTIIMISIHILQALHVVMVIAGVNQEKVNVIAAGYSHEC
jgi:hypothetical protein